MSEILDVSATIAAKSDQLNADDLIAGPLTGTITNVTRGTPDQPIDILLDCWKQPYKPCKTMRRALVILYGNDAKKWIGKRLTLVRDPDVMFGGQKVGGIRISHATGAGVTMSLTATRGKKASVTIQNLEDGINADDFARMFADLKEQLQDRDTIEKQCREWGIVGPVNRASSWTREQFERAVSELNKMKGGV